jgi:hypothetical protein
MHHTDTNIENVIPYHGPWTVIDLKHSKQIYTSQAEAIHFANSLVCNGAIVEINAELCVIKLLKPNTNN